MLRMQTVILKLSPYLERVLPHSFNATHQHDTSVVVSFGRDSFFYILCEIPGENVRTCSDESHMERQVRTDVQYLNLSTSDCIANSFNGQIQHDQYHLYV